MSDTPVYLPWTPAIYYTDAAGVAYVTPPVGHSVKVGSLVTVSFDIRLSSKGTGSPSPVIVKGLPYAATGIGFGAVRWTAMARPMVWMGVSTNAGLQTLLLYGLKDAQPDSALLQSGDILDATGLIGTVSYFAAP